MANKFIAGVLVGAIAGSITTVSLTSFITHSYVRRIAVESSTIDSATAPGVTSVIDSISEDSLTVVDTLEVQSCLPVDTLKISSSYGYRKDPKSKKRSFHNGVDLKRPKGSKIYAVRDGVVTRVGYDDRSGRKVAIRHSDSTESFYAHLGKIYVSKSDTISACSVIGTVGLSGRTTGAHLHYGLRNSRGQWIKPEFLP